MQKSHGQTPVQDPTPRTNITNKNNVLLPVPSINARTPKQATLEIRIARQKEINGVGMGVLSDGTPYLTGRGLAKLCGVDSSRISEISNDWLSKKKHATRGILKILFDRGITTIEKPFLEIMDSGNMVHAFPDIFCLAVLEYYAFDASTGPNPQAIKSYRLLAGRALHDFIYTQVGYATNENIPESWAQFHARVSLTYNSLPIGYFGIFKELADMIVTLGNAGLHIDSEFVPDISVGLLWSKFWECNKLDEKFGTRQKWNHNYPSIFPQSKSNPQNSWCYPESALAEFRRWLREDYIGQGKFSKYINSQILKKSLPPSFAQVITQVYELDK